MAGRDDRPPPRFADDVEKMLNGLNLSTRFISKEDRALLGSKRASALFNRHRSIHLQGMTITRYSSDCLTELAMVTGVTKARIVDMAIRHLHKSMVLLDGKTMVAPEVVDDPEP